MATAKLRTLDTAKGLTPHELELINKNFFDMEAALNSIGAVTPGSTGSPPSSIPISHGGLLNLGSPFDDHLQYILNTGRVGGQILLSNDSTTPALTIQGLTASAIPETSYLVRDSALNDLLRVRRLNSNPEFLIGSPNPGGSRSYFTFTVGAAGTSKLNIFNGCEFRFPNTGLEVWDSNPLFLMAAKLPSSGLFTDNTNGVLFRLSSSGLAKAVLAAYASDTASGLFSRFAIWSSGTIFTNAASLLTIPVPSAINHSVNLGAIGVIIGIDQGVFGQTGALRQWRDSSGAVLSQILAAGTFSGPVVIPTAKTFQYVDGAALDAVFKSDAAGFGTWTTGVLNNNARVNVRKNTGADVGTRRRLNFIEGTNVTMTIADDAGSEEVDITINSLGGGGSAGFLAIAKWGTD